MDWFKAARDHREDREAVRRRDELKERLLPSFSKDLKKRYERLEQLKTDQSLPSELRDKPIYRDLGRKLDHLLEHFLLFGGKQAEFQRYLGSLHQETCGMGSAPAAGRPSEEDRWVNGMAQDVLAAFDKEIRGIEASLGQDANLHNQAVLEKRRAVLQRRQEHVDRIKEILLNLGHQLRLMEDTVGLVNDELRARSPEQVLAEIDELVLQTDKLTESLQEISPFEKLR